MINNPDDIPISLEPGKSHFSKRIIKKYGKGLLKRITGNEIIEDNIEFIDLDKSAWDSIKKAASESKWMPKEYFMNDWVADVCNFLRNGNEKS